jgi:putative redox protein
MSVRVDIAYEGNLRCNATHAPSKTALATDAPVDNQGLGGSFSPTDLVGTALGTCMLTTVAIAARNRGLALDRAHAVVDKDMIADPKRRVGKLTVKVSLPSTLNAEARAHLEDVARHCPVALTLSDRTVVDLSFSYD